MRSLLKDYRLCKSDFAHDALEPTALVQSMDPVFGALPSSPLVLVGLQVS